MFIQNSQHNLLKLLCDTHFRIRYLNITIFRQKVIIVSFGNVRLLPINGLMHQENVFVYVRFDVPDKIWGKQTALGIFLPQTPAHILPEHTFEQVFLLS